MTPIERRNRTVAWLAGFSAIMGLVLGLANNMDNGIQAQLLSEQNALNREYIDLMLAQRLAPIQPVSPVWQSAKQTEIEIRQLGVNTLSGRLESVGSVELLLAFGLILCQLAILDREVLDSATLSRKARLSLNCLVGVGVLAGFVGAGWFLWVSLSN